MKPDPTFHLTPPPATDTHEVRFRAVSADGQEAVSAPLKLRPLVAPPKAFAIGSAHFGHARYHSGQEIWLFVEAKGADGESARMVVERETKGEWKPIADLRAILKDGAAQALLPALEKTKAPPAPPPAKGEKEPEKKAEPFEAKLRFTAIVGFEKKLSEVVAVTDRSGGGKLGKPQWSHVGPAGAQFHHADEAHLRVDAPGLDGERVAFHVEQLSGDKWLPYATVHGEVQKGVAEAALKLVHPAFPLEPKGVANKRGGVTKPALVPPLPPEPVALRFLVELD